MDPQENLPPPSPGPPPGISAAPRQAGPSGEPGPSSVSGSDVAGGSGSRPGPSRPPSSSVAPRFRPIARNSQLGTKGVPTPLMANHYKVQFNPRAEVYHYNIPRHCEIEVTIEPATKKVVSRKVMSKLYDTFGREFLNGKRFAYDGEKSLFTAGPLAYDSHQFPVHLDDEPGRGRRGGNSIAAEGNSPEDEEGRPSQRRRVGGRDFEVEIKFSAKVNMSAIQQVLNGTADELRVLDIMLREHAARRDYLLIRGSYFHSSLGKVDDIGEGALAVVEMFPLQFPAHLWTLFDPQFR